MDAAMLDYIWELIIYRRERIHESVIEITEILRLKICCSYCREIFVQFKEMGDMQILETNTWTRKHSTWRHESWYVSPWEIKIAQLFRLFLTNVNLKTWV